MAAAATPVLAEDIGSSAIHDAPAGSPLRALCKPAFCPDGSGLFITGTECQDRDLLHLNRLVFAHIDFEHSVLGTRSNGTPAIWTHGIDEHVRDVRWMDPENVVVAMGSTLALCYVSHKDLNELTCEVIQFPEFHTDYIREISINPEKKSLVLSGGFDGHVYVTDLNALYAALGSGTSTIQNTMYKGEGEVVGSVNWRFGSTNEASATTDPGKLHVFDIRTEMGAPAVMYDTGKSELYGHAFMDTNTVLLGFGDGHVETHDLRKRGCIGSVKDVYEDAIGDVHCKTLPDGSCVCITGGHPGVSVWTALSSADSATSLAISSHHRAAGVKFEANPSYKISGAFVGPESMYFAACDSVGSILILDTTGVSAPKPGTGEAGPPPAKPALQSTE